MCSLAVSILEEAEERRIYFQPVQISTKENPVVRCCIKVPRSARLESPLQSGGQTVPSVGHTGCGPHGNIPVKEDSNAAGFGFGKTMSLLDSFVCGSGLLPGQRDTGTTSASGSQETLEKVTRAVPYS